MATKKIVILMDGTSNQTSAKRPNILRLYGALEKHPSKSFIMIPASARSGS